MVRHFGDCGVNNMQPVILEKVRSSDPFIRKGREQFYIDLLETEISALKLRKQKLVTVELGFFFESIIKLYFTE